MTGRGVASPANYGFAEIDVDAPAPAQETANTARNIADVRPGISLSVRDEKSVDVSQAYRRPAFTGTIPGKTPVTYTYCRVCRLHDTTVSAWLPAAFPFKSLN